MHRAVNRLESRSASRHLRTPIWRLRLFVLRALQLFHPFSLLDQSHFVRGGLGLLLCRCNVGLLMLYVEQLRGS